MTSRIDSRTLDHRDIQHRVSQLDDLPPLPRALQRLIEIIQDEIASARELESLVKYDQGLSARLLRIANSAYYGLRSEVTTLSRAIMTIGYFKVRSLCLSALLIEFFSNSRSLSSALKESFWKHSFATGRIASEIAKKRSWVNEEQAYILGLLHDLGRIVMAIHFNSHYQIIRNLAESRTIPMWCAEIQCGLTHTQIGKWVAVKWAFPEIFQMVMEFHHAPQLSDSFGPEVKLIHLADLLSHSEESDELPIDEFTLSVCRELFITEDEWSELQEQLSIIWPEVDQLWNLLK